MYTKTIYYEKPPSLRLSDEEINQLVALVNVANEIANAERAFAEDELSGSYEAAWRELYESERCYG